MSTMTKSVSWLLSGTLAATLGWQAPADAAASRSRRGEKVPEVYKEYKVVEVTNGGTIEGTVLFKGELPKPERIMIVKDQKVCSHHPPQRPRIVVNDEKQVANVVVFLNIKEGKAPPKPEKKVFLNQKHCEFEPHVQVMHVDEAFEILNSDEVLHNIQASQNRQTVFNHVQPKKGMTQEEKFAAIGLVQLSCQAHNWMQGWIYVLPHPYHAVTDEKGRFKIRDIPPGEYELHVWQEHLGEQVTDVQVKAGETTKVEYELEEPRRRRR